jgi:superfamily II DNA or RNA helicase
MQISQLVTVRRAPWRIDGIRAYDDCQLVTLTGVAPPNLGVQRRVLAPFETIDPIDRVRRPRFVRATLWRRACRALAAGETPPGGLRTIRHARLDVMPHQLEPALAILRGLGSRLLLADDVGLGKTIQAGIVIAELRARGSADRVLVLTPAGLREQWAQELRARFDIDAEVADAATLRTRRATLPVGINPWTIARVAIASIDYVKRPEVLPAVAASPWDVLVVDEAHGAAGNSERRDAVGALASQAAYVLLLTATPHSGDRQSFASLSGLGALDSVDRDPLLVFRRRRSDIRAGASRRVHALHVRPSAAQARMHTLLARYTSAIHAEQDRAWLAASVLHKRALSSAWSLAQSIKRRLEFLARTDRDDPGEQLTLPLGDPDGELTAADEPPAWPAGLGLADTARETRLLRDLLAAAELAAHGETKLDAVRRILRRSREPAIVFTEYRDTLLHLQRRLERPAAVLHGGLTRDERAAALADFSAQRQSVLLATDAAGEGLNLHQRCRLVINLELPWNPMRLEQRIGRVDRIGQRRTVHAWHLIAAGTGETRILSRLKDRVARARDDIGAPDPFGDDEERAAARLVVLGQDDEARLASVAQGFSPAIDRRNIAGLNACATGNCESEAVSEARRLAAARALTRDDDDAARLLVDSDGPWIVRARRSAVREALRHRIVLFWAMNDEDACGRLVESTCIPTVVTLARLPATRDRVWIEEILRQVDGDVRRLLDESNATRCVAVERIAQAFASARLTRERAIAAHRATAIAGAFQPGLFDRRAERSRFAVIAERQLADRDRSSRIERLELSAIARPAAPRLLLVLVP